MEELTGNHNNIDLKHGKGNQIGNGNKQINIFYGDNPDEEKVAETIDANSPYLGLASFTAETSKNFYGRKKLVESLLQDLEKDNLIFLLGASGSGKSSLVKAGMIPQLIQSNINKPFVELSFVPSNDPFDNFFDELKISLPKKLSLYSKSEIKSVFQGYDNPKVNLPNIIEQIRLGKNASWLIFIDQFEEILTTTSKEEGLLFIQFLDNLISSLRKSKDNSIKLILAIRTDFLDQFMNAFPDFVVTIQSDGRKPFSYITPMTDGELKLVIKNPAATHGVNVDLNLIEEIINDFRGEARSLPLLQYTLDLLWQKDNLSDSLLNKETYENLGKVGGALQQQAEKIYQDFETRGQGKPVEDIFIQLVTITADGKRVSKRESKSKFTGETGKVVDELVKKHRLLVAGRQEGMVEIAHEALISSWERLQDWITKYEKEIILERQLKEAAQSWKKDQADEKKAISELWTGPKLMQVKEVLRAKLVTKSEDALRTYYGDVTADFIKESCREYERRKQREIDFELSLANSLGRYSLSLFNERKELDAFIEAIKAGKILQQHKAHSSTVLAALQKVFYEGSEINRLEGHSKTINSESISPNGKILASGSDDNTIKLWNLDTGQEIRTLTGHNYAVYDVCISPNGQILASVSRDYTIKIWNLDTGQEIDTLIDYKEKSDIEINFSSDGKILCISYKSSSVNISPDGQISFISDSDSDRQKKIEYWNLKIDKEISLNKLDSNTNISQNEEISTSSHDNKTIEFWNPAIKKTLTICKEDRIIKLLLLQKNINQKMDIFTGHTQVIYSISISQDGKILVSGSGDRTIKLWDLETGKEIQTFQHHESVISVGISPDAKTLISVGERTIKKWDLDKKDEIFTFQRNLESIIRVSVSPDSKTLAYNSVNSKTITLVDIEENKEISMTGHDDSVNNVDISSDGKTLVSSSFYNIVKLWDLETNTQIETLTIETLTKDNFFTITSVNISFDRKTLATGRGDGRITFWNVNTKKEIITIQGHQKAVSSVNFSPDGKRLASGDSDGNIKLWSFDLDFLMKESCYLVRNYLTYNPNVSESDRHLCDGIGTKQ